jgi:flavin-dependent dehydrogenase
VESVSSGWLFLIPCGAGRGSLISVGAGAEELLAESRLVSGQIKRLGTSTGSFPAYPRIISPLGGQDWIACGTAAIAFDPIAGEGAGNALREGILASAVIRAAEGGKPEDLMAHYSNRMVSGFLRHVQECTRFYTAVSGPWWEAEAEAMRLGVERAQEALTLQHRSFFRLVGFELQARS